MKPSLLTRVVAKSLEGDSPAPPASPVFSVALWSYPYPSLFELYPISLFCEKILKMP